MSITIGSNSISLMVQRQLGGATERLSLANERLSSGARINRAKDDAAGLAIAESLSANARIFRQGQRNLNDTMSLVAVQKAALDEMTKIVVRQRELAEQSANGVYSNVQRQALDNESRELTNEYNRIINTADFNGRKVLLNPYEELRSQFGVGLDNSIAFEFGSEIMTKLEAGQYFTVDGVEKNFYVWFTIDGQGVDPALFDRTGREVNLVSDPNSARSEITELTFNAADSISSGNWFFLYSGTKAYQVWFQKGGTGEISANEVVSDATQVKVSITAGQTAEEVKQAALSALGSAAGGDFVLSDAGAGMLRVETEEKLSIRDGLWRASGSGLSSLSIAQQGAGFLDSDSISKSVWGALRTDDIDAAPFYRKELVVRQNAQGVLEIQTARPINDGNIASSCGCLIVDTCQEGAGRSAYTMGDYPQNAYLEDLNSDECLDLVSADSSSDTLSVRLNNGNGTFQARAAYAMGDYPYNAYLEDLNGDGNIDLVSADTNSDTLSVRLNNGNGTFIARAVYTMGRNPREAYLKDLNSDGCLDLVSVDGNSDTLSVRLNNGNGTFMDRAAYTMGDYPYHAYLKDLNSDGSLDLISVDQSSDTLSVRLNNGNGTFMARATYTMGDYPEKAYLKDLNSDGRLDLISADGSSDTLSVRLNNGNGTFMDRAAYAMGDYPYNAYLEDLNSDGCLDLISADGSSDTLSVRLNNGNGTFMARAAYAMGDGPQNAYLEDLNSDSCLDLVSADRHSDTLSIRLNNGNGTFMARDVYTMGNYPLNAYLEDLNSDGCLDLISADGTSDTLSVRLNDGSGGFCGGGSEAAERPEITYLHFGDGRGMAVVGHVDLSSQASSRDAMDVLDTRLERISRQVGVLGAVEARLQVALNTITTTRENYISAESRIRDTDVADEAAKSLSAQILQQSAQLVLAQANQGPAIALALLR